MIFPDAEHTIPGKLGRHAELRSPRRKEERHNMTMIVPERKMHFCDLIVVIAPYPRSMYAAASITPAMSIPLSRRYIVKHDFRQRHACD